MSKFRGFILALSILIIAIAVSLLTVLGLYAAGVLRVETIELVYEIENASKTYDGNPLHPSSYELVSGELLKGHTASVTLSGELTEVGSGESDLSVKITDENGHDVSNEYAVKVEKGALDIAPAEITVLLDHQQVVYNGSKVEFNDYQVIQGALVKGHKIEGSIPNAGLVSVGDRLPQNLMPVVYDTWGKDVTANYKVTFMIGEIEIVPRPIVVKPVDVSKTYDGTPLTATQYEIVSGTLASDQWAEVVINNGNNSLTNAGSADLRITDIAIYTLNGTQKVDVSENYEIDLSETGKISVGPRDLTVTAKSASWTYDGTQHTFEEDSLPESVVGLASSDRLNYVTYSGSVKDVGTAPNEIVEIGLSSSPDNYNVTCVAGKLAVTARDITVITPTETKEYSGEELTGTTPEIVNGVTGHTVAAAGETPSITDVGSVSNYYKCAVTDEAGNDVSANYRISYSYGILTVTKKPVSFKANDLTKEYNGQEQLPTIKDAMKNADLPEALKEEDFEIVTYGTMKNAGTYIYSARLKNFDTVKNYDLTVDAGKFKITPIEATLNYSSDGVTKTYDGKPVEVPVTAIAVNTSILDKNYSVLSVEYGSYIKPGTYPISLHNARIRDRDTGEDVTDNFTIVYTGAVVTATIYTRPLFLALDTYYHVGADYPTETELDFTTLNGLVRVESGLAEGDYLDPDVLFVSYDPATHTLMLVSVGIKNSQGVDVSDYYELGILPTSQVTLIPTATTT